MENDDKTAAGLLEKWSAMQPGRGGACVIGLSGHLGAGKTAFVKRIAAKLGIEETVTSPTFVLMKIYETGNAGAAFKRLVHIDAYRLEKHAELEGLDFERVASDPHNLVMVEWPENAGVTGDDLDAWLEFAIRDGSYHIDPK